MSTRTSRKQVDDFLDLKRIAIVGVSRNPKDFTHTVWQEFRQRGYEAIPVNPNATELDGQRCYGRVQDIQPPVQGAVIMTRPDVTDKVVHDCKNAGIRHVWMHRGGGVGAVSRTAVEYCDANGIDVIEGFCPYMFLPGTPFFHGMHVFVKKLTRSFPA